MVFEGIFSNHEFDNIVAYSGKDITKGMLDACFEIDTQFYDEKYYWNRINIKNVVEKFGQFCFVFYDKEDKEVMGYSFWFPIKTRVFNNFISEKKMLLDLKEEYCDNIADKNEINLFLGGEAFVAGYDLFNLHNAIEDVFQKRILDLAYRNKKIKYIAMESCCKYDEEILEKKLGLTKLIKKDKSRFYYDIYSPEKVYKNSKYSKELKKFYN